MIYHVIGTMSGSSLDGLDIVYAELSDIAGQWDYTIHQASTLPYTEEWVERIRSFDNYSAKEYAQLDSDFGFYMGELILQFMQENDLQHKINFVSSHGHTSFHEPHLGYSEQIGLGAHIASITGKSTITDLRQMDVASGGQGAPIVPMAEKLLYPDNSIFLNLGGIANVSIHENSNAIHAYDITAANRVLNLLANKLDLAYDKGGEIARSGSVIQDILDTLNQQEYFSKPYPKSLSNSFGIEVLFPLLDSIEKIEDALSTYTEHIAEQLFLSLQKHSYPKREMLITGGGAYNTYLVERIENKLAPLGIIPQVPDSNTVEYKEALAMALLGVLRWREEATVLSAYSGARQSSIGGAIWMV